MTEEEILKQKYRTLRSSLNNINRKVASVQSKCNDLEKMLSDALLIDDCILNKKDFKEIRSNLKNVYNDLNQNVIPRVSNKC